VEKTNYVQAIFAPQSPSRAPRSAPRRRCRTLPFCCVRWRRRCWVVHFLLAHSDSRLRRGPQATA